MADTDSPYPTIMEKFERKKRKTVGVILHVFMYLFSSLWLKHLAQQLASVIAGRIRLSVDMMVLLRLAAPASKFSLLSASAPDQSLISLLHSRFCSLHPFSHCLELPVHTRPEDWGRLATASDLP